jgi:anti-sigma factor RsiW
MMPCSEVLGLTPYFLDDELDVQDCLRMEEHLRCCAACANALAAEGRLRLAVRDALQQVRAPADLRLQVRSTMAARRRPAAALLRRWPVALTAALLLALLWRGQGSTGDGLTQAATLSHRSNPPMDVQLSEVAQVERYLSTHLPFPVRLPASADTGWLRGGRVVRLADRDAALVRFELPRGRISVFVYEESPTVHEIEPHYRMRRPTEVRRVGAYSAARWQEDGLGYAVVSDLPVRDLPGVIHAIWR